MVRPAGIQGREKRKGVLMLRLQQYVFLLLILVAGCRTKTQHTMTTTHSVKHLTLTIDDSIAVGNTRDRTVAEQMPEGFHVYTSSGSRRRYKIEAWVEMRHDDASPSGQWYEEKKVEGRTIHYRVDRSEAGMGGWQYDFHAWEPCPGGYLFYRQSEIVEEPALPAFDLVWNVIKGTAISPVLR